MNDHPVSRLSRWLALAAATLFAGAGCVPNVVWLPDSSGIIYTTTDWPDTRESKLPREKQGRLMHYDLAKKTTRVIAQTGTRTIQPALSPDGKKIAVALLIEPTDKPPALQVIVYDLDGKELQRSKSFAWENSGAAAKVEEPAKFPQLFWAPRENKVLVCANGITGICDLDKDQVVSLGAAIPILYGVTPIRPDGKGFLMASADRKVAFADWQGKTTAIDVPFDKLADREKDIVLIPSAVCWSRWDGPVAVATWKRRQLRLDTEKMTATVEEKPAWSLDGQEIHQLHAFPGGKTRLAVLFEISFRDFRDAGLHIMHAKLLGPEPNQSRELTGKTYVCGVYPSPDHKLVALRYADQVKGADGPQDMILIVNQAGDTVAQIETRK